MNPSLLWHIVLSLQIIALFSVFNTAIYCVTQRRFTAAAGLILLVVYLVVAGARVASHSDLDPAPDYVLALAGVTMLSFTLAKRRRSKQETEARHGVSQTGR